MSEKDWYYVKDDKQEGPIPESKMQEMFDAGHLEPDTLVWSDSLTEWTAASQTTSFRVNGSSPSPPPAPSPTPIQAKSVQEDNTSGQGREAVIPDEIRKWNWGAFFLSWIWGLGNKTYIALLFFIPFCWFVLPFVLGAKGSEWAWRNKRWTSIEHFKDVQKVWALVGLFVVIIPVIGITAAIAIPNYMLFQGKAATVEARTELTNIRTLEAFYYAENMEYGSLTSIGWEKPAGNTRYTYSLEHSATTFLARAEGNLDNDPTIDVWTIDQDDMLNHLVDDTME